MTTKTDNSIYTAAHSERHGRPARSFRSLRWLNGSVHWISAVVLVYAFLINGETTGALMNPVAMRGEVKRRRPHFPCPVYLGAKQALGRRAMGRVVGSNAAVQNPADNRLGDLSRGVGLHRFGASDRISSTRCRAHPGGQRVYHQQPSFERYD